MKVLVTDLTRMQGGHICVAGIDIDKNKRVRPVAAQALSARLLATNGGPLDIRRVVDIGRTAPRRSRPEIEDVRCDPRSIRSLTVMPGREFLQRLAALAAPDFAAIGPDLQRRGRNLVVSEGKGKCSLVIVRTTEMLRVHINAEGRLRLAWENEIELPITDLRLFDKDLRTPDTAKAQSLQQQLEVGSETFLCFGLGRPFEGFHWLQLNNIHLSTNPAWQLQ
jgi:hypothetical protein